MREKKQNNDILTLGQIRQMEVIDISEGKRLGFISDLVFDEDITKIEEIIIPPESGFLSLFKRKDEIHIKWNQIKVIGVDIILVDTGKEKSNEEVINDEENE